MAHDHPVPRRVVAPHQEDVAADRPQVGLVDSARAHPEPAALVARGDVAVAEAAYAEEPLEVAEVARREELVHREGRGEQVELVESPARAPDRGGRLVAIPQHLREVGLEEVVDHQRRRRHRFDARVHAPEVVGPGAAVSDDVVPLLGGDEVGLRHPIPRRDQPDGQVGQRPREHGVGLHDVVGEGVRELRDRADEDRLGAAPEGTRPAPGEEAEDEPRGTGIVGVPVPLRLHHLTKSGREPAEADALGSADECEVHAEDRSRYSFETGTQRTVGESTTGGNRRRRPPARDTQSPSPLHSLPVRRYVCPTALPAPPGKRSP